MARKRKKDAGVEMNSQLKGIMLTALAVFVFVGLAAGAHTGSIGGFINHLLRTLAGEAAPAVPLLIALTGLRLVIPFEIKNFKTRMAGLCALAALYAAWVHLRLITERMPFTSAGNLFFESFLLGREGGGIAGAALAGALYYLLGAAGSRILVAALALVFMLITVNIAPKTILKWVFRFFRGLYRFFRALGAALCAGSAKLIKSIVDARPAGNSIPGERGGAAPAPDDPAGETEADSFSPGETVGVPLSQLSVEDYRSVRGAVIPPMANGIDTEGEKPIIAVRGRSGAKNYIFPGRDLLNEPGPCSEQKHTRSSRERAKILENTLHNFGVRARVVHVQSGPTVTRFEVQPEAGVKVSRIVSLSDDIALNLAAPLVRIEAPIPGKAALGIEVPNSVISLVSLREVIDENAFKNSTSPLTIALGKDITGVPVIADLTRMPHLLIAGATGAGKSVCLNTLITSILYKAGPDRVRFMMIDPKVVELSIFNGIPHLLMPVITDPRKASLALKNMVREMGRRYELFARLGVRDIGTYNDMAAEDEELEDLPLVVVVIDELADLMHVAPGDVEDAIARLAQMSRAAGIHLLVATQRPSVDVLTGLIKANITSRIAFTVSSQFDSRTILDMGGAEKLLGRGDMLFYPVGAVKPFRVQGAFISEGEVKQVTDFIREQGLLEEENGCAFLDAPEETNEEEADVLLPEAVDVVVRTGQASISLLQRRFRIGYTRAARLIDDLERRGIVGQFEGSKPREVLITPEQAARFGEEFRQQ